MSSRTRSFIISIMQYFFFTWKLGWTKNHRFRNSWTFRALEIIIATDAKSTSSSSSDIFSHSDLKSYAQPTVVSKIHELSVNLNNNYSSKLHETTLVWTCTFFHQCWLTKVDQFVDLVDQPKWSRACTKLQTRNRVICIVISLFSGDFTSFLIILRPPFIHPWWGWSKIVDIQIGTYPNFCVFTAWSLIFLRFSDFGCFLNFYCLKMNGNRYKISNVKV